MMSYRFFSLFSKSLSTALPKRVQITEVGARDGLQNIKKFIDTSDKIKLVNMLTNSGFKDIEATSFVNAKAVPQFVDAAEVFSTIEKMNDCNYHVLVANVKGFEQAAKSGVKTVSIFLSASEEFSKKNINCSIDESFKRLEELSKHAKEKNIKMRGYVSCSIDCPYQGKIDKQMVKMVAKELFDAGCYEVSVADTIGTGTVSTVNELLEFLLLHFSRDDLALHFHDTYGQGLSNTLAALDHGIYKFDSAIGGLGGCPFAGGQASGNLATEDLLYLFRGLNIETGVTMPKFLDALEFVRSLLPLQSKSGAVLLKNRSKY